MTISKFSIVCSSWDTREASKQGTQPTSAGFQILWLKRCEEFLDLEIRHENPLLKQKEHLHGIIEKATPEQMQKILSLLGT